MTLSCYAFESLFSYLLESPKILSRAILQEGIIRNNQIIDSVLNETDSLKKLLLTVGLIARIAAEAFFDSSDNPIRIAWGFVKLFAATSLSILLMGYCMTVPLYFIELNLVFFFNLLLLIGFIYLVHHNDYFLPIREFNSVVGLEQILTNLPIVGSWLGATIS